MKESLMRVLWGVGLALAAALPQSAAGADELKSGPEKKIGGPFHVKAVTGDNAGKSLGYI
jgi:hypothetical protein